MPLFAVLICTICIHLVQFGWHHAPEATICMVSIAIYDPAMSILLGLQNVGSTRATIQPSCSDSWQLWIILCQCFKRTLGWLWATNPVTNGPLIFYIQLRLRLSQCLSVRLSQCVSRGWCLSSEYPDNHRPLSTPTLHSLPRLCWLFITQSLHAQFNNIQF